jgi:DNA-binding helix-hairpin-helix protein with protein kinase domain
MEVVSSQAQIYSRGEDMDGQLTVGTILHSDCENAYKVEKLLGAGGQGEVYEVSCGAEHYALKYYYKHTATPEQKKILEHLVEKGAPDSSFLWPLDMVKGDNEQSYGYIMKLRPKEYKSIVDLMKRRAEPSFANLTKAAFNLTKGYQKLHTAGFCYRDISFGNVFFNPDNGDVLICDNDNVAANGEQNTGVYGTPRFMAPEIVRGEAVPSRNTDLFSLAVLLFYMFMLNHPLEGRQEARIKCMDIAAMNYLYGTNPIFIFDPDNKENRPLTGYQDNANIYWNLYPRILKDLFIKSFTVGLAQPAKRVTENKWLEILANMIQGIIICPNCGAEVYYDKSKEETGIPLTCWKCRKEVKIPAKMHVGKNTIMITSDMKLYEHDIKNNFDIKTVAGEVAVNPKNPLLWGIRNLTKENWTYKKKDGSQIPVPPGRSAAIIEGASINFGPVTATFSK